MTSRVLELAPQVVERRCSPCPRALVVLSIGANALIRRIGIGGTSATFEERASLSTPTLNR